MAIARAQLVDVALTRWEFRGHHESAGINRHGVADARAAQGTSSEPP
jgi:hypothetical protein